MYNGNVIEGHCVDHRIRDAAVGLSVAAEPEGPGIEVTTWVR
jgi:hypothetical protein